MKLHTLLLGTTLIFGFVAKAQDDPDRECQRMRFLGGEEYKMKNYALAGSYYLKGETLCGNYVAEDYTLLIASYRNAIATEKDKDRKTAFIDTTLSIYDRMDEKGFFEDKDLLVRADYLTRSSKPDLKKADSFFRKAIELNMALSEREIQIYYYNLFMIHREAAEAEKMELKKRMISEYFRLSKVMTDANMSLKTQETITTYFNYVVQSCGDILPELEGYMANLPEDKAAKKAAILNFLTLLETKGCTESAEYEKLVLALDEVDPSFDSKIAVAKLLVVKKKYSDAIAAFKQAKPMTTDADQIDMVEYEIVVAYYKQGSYQSAYNAAMGISGKNKGNALVIAGHCVAKMANGCGSSTFDRKCNYIYADQLIDRGISAGGSGASRGMYRGSYPTSDECFDNGSPASVSLSCWGVSVSPCN